MCRSEWEAIPGQFQNQKFFTEEGYVKITGIAEILCHPAYSCTFGQRKAAQLVIHLSGYIRYSYAFHHRIIDKIVFVRLVFLLQNGIGRAEWYNPVLPPYLFAAAVIIRGSQIYIRPDQTAAEGQCA
ncbi:hypothetical protein D3C73_1369420 [compost metagenome]